MIADTGVLNKYEDLKFVIMLALGKAKPSEFRKDYRKCKRKEIEEIRNKFINQTTESYLIMLDNKYIGIIDFLANNLNDNCSWIGLLMIRGDYHSLGFTPYENSWWGDKQIECFEKQLI